MDVGPLGAAFSSNVTGNGSTQVVQTMLGLVGAILATTQLDFLANEPTMDGDLEVDPGLGNGGSLAQFNAGTGPETIYRLREGIERFLITDINNPAGSAQAQSEVFVMSDNLSVDVARFNHIPGGCNVLYMDGHVSFVRFPGTAPVTSPVATFIGSF
ncbi:MAG: hypothetical protein HC888_14450 [Candidatus Competibacteraceae bacterium]|nr:hypothetical protein [Candidatus Competibacteraceae bacterium]